MLWLFKSCVLSITLISLAACGTRGPLYLAPQQLPPPIKAPTAQKTPSTPAPTPQTYPNTTKDQD